MEETSVFALSGFQYIIMAVVVTKGYPHKKPLYHNGESSAKVQGWEFGMGRAMHSDSVVSFNNYKWNFVKL